MNRVLRKGKRRWREKRNKNGKKIWTISRFVRVILAQGPC